MINPEIIGYIAATLTTICFIPQALKVIKTKDTAALSLLMYLLFTIGVSFWLIYGFMIKSYPVIIANVFTAILSAIILYYKATEERRIAKN